LSDRQLARAGAVEHGRDLTDEIGGEAAASRVFEDVFGGARLVHAVDLVARDVAVPPRVRPAQRRDDVVGLLRDPAQLLVGELACAPGSRAR
jgi:hypothetical protein